MAKKAAAKVTARAPRKRPAPVVTSGRFIGDVEPEAQYRISLREPIEWEGVRLLPRNGMAVVKGKVVLANREAMASVDPL